MADAVTPLKVTELPNRIRTLDEKTPIQIDQNFEEIVYSLAAVQKFLNANVVGATDGTSDFETNAITYGAGDPVDE